MLSRFHPISEITDRQTDRRTELLYQYRVSVCWRAIKKLSPHKSYACSRIAAAINTNTNTTNTNNKICYNTVTNVFSPWKLFSAVKNYPTLKFMLQAAAATTGFPYASSREPPEIYCCYFVCAADARSVSNS